MGRDMGWSRVGSSEGRGEILGGGELGAVRGGGLGVVRGGERYRELGAVRGGGLGVVRGEIQGGG